MKQQDAGASRGFSAGAVEGFIQSFLRGLENARPETQRTYRQALKLFVLWVRLHDRCFLTADEMRRYRDWMTETRGLADASVSTYLTAVRRLCQYCVRKGVLPHNPVRRVPGNRRPSRHRREGISPGEAERLLACVDRSGTMGKRDYAILRLILDCGLSEIEIIRANRADLRADKGNMILLVQGKGRTAKDQEAVLPEQTGTAVAEYLAVAPGDKGDPMFASAGNRTRGMRMTGRGVRNRVRHCLKIAGILKGRRRITPNSLRRTAAQMMAQEGASALEIKKRMRLGSVATVLVYLAPAAGRTTQPT